MSDYSYAGQELDLFADAVNWKSYFRSRLAPHIRGNVLEAGAGIGGTTRVLCAGSETSWLCLEPDPQLAERLVESTRIETFPIRPEVVNGGLTDLDADRRFDTILYIDVLEHIENDRAELQLAQAHLNEGGKLVLLSPAFQFLYSPFDEAVGHFRRYDKKSLTAVIPPTLERVALFYLDSMGLMTSLLNRFVLRQGTPSRDQIQLWDRVIVRLSRLTDPLTLYSLGRSLIAIYRKPDSAQR